MFVHTLTRGRRKLSGRYVYRRVLCLALTILVSVGAESAPVPVLISTDLGNEIDDQWALLHLLTSDRFRVVGIASAHAPPTSVPGGPKTSAALIRNIVEDRLVLKVHPPIVVGADSPLVDERTPRHSDAVGLILSESRRYSANNRLTIVVLGAATDVASSLVLEPRLGERVRIVAMGFRSWAEGGNEFNVHNDPAAWRVILDASVPLTIGDGEVTRRSLAVTRDEAAAIVDHSGALAPWLLRDYDSWYESHIRTFEPTRPDGKHAWPIWDQVVVAHLLGFTQVQVRPRPLLEPDLSFAPGRPGSSVEWITAVDRDRLFDDFQEALRGFASRHGTRDEACLTIASAPSSCRARP